MMKNMRMGTKLVIIGSLIMIIPLAAVTFMAVARSRSALETLGKDEMITRSTDLATIIDKVCVEEMKLLKAIASDPDVLAAAALDDSKGVAKAADALKSAQAKLLPYATNTEIAGSYEGVVLIGKDGIVRASSLASSIGQNLADRDYVVGALKGKVNIGAVVASKVSGKPIVPMAVPVLSGSRVVGVCALFLNTTFMNDLIGTVKIGSTGYPCVIDNRGLTIAHPKEEQILTLNFLETEGMKEFAKEMIAGRTGYDAYRLNGVDKMAGYAPVKSTGWSLALTMEKSDNSFTIAADELMRILLIISAVSLVLGVLIFFLFARSITGPIVKGVEFAKKLAAGDFTHTLGLKRGDEIGTLSQALDGMCATLRGMVGTIQQNAQQVATSSEEISASAHRLSEGAQSQASTLEETSASVEELSTSVDQVAEHSQSQAGLVTQGTQSMNDVQKSITEASASLTEIAALAQKSVENALQGAKAVTEVMEGIGRIAESSERIGGIIEVISDIADQTNLLSLNASIEAARAGEHGRGFAVVADEVSKLADRSATSTKEIESLIKESVHRVSEGVSTARGSQEAMERIREASQQVSNMISGVAKTMDRQVAMIREMAAALESMNEMSQSISTAAEEQSTNTKQVSKAVENVNEITQSAAAAAEEMSTATEQMAAMAQDLQKLMSGFRIAARESGDDAEGPAGEPSTAHTLVE